MYMYLPPVPGVSTTLIPFSSNPFVRGSSCFLCKLQSSVHCQAVPQCPVPRCSALLSFCNAVFLSLHDHPYLGASSETFLFCFVFFCKSVPSLCHGIELYQSSSCIKKDLSNTQLRIRDISLSISSHLCCLRNYLGLPHRRHSHCHCFLILALHL